MSSGRFFVLALIFSLYIGIHGWAHETLSDRGPWVVRAYYSDRSMIQALASWRAPWSIERQKQFVILNLNDTDEYEYLGSLGFRIEIEPELTRKYFGRPKLTAPERAGGIPGYPCFRTVEETYQAAEQICALHPQLASLIYIGDSWEKTQDPLSGYELRVLRLTNANVIVDKPVLFVMASVHAREYVPAELCTRFAEYLVANYGSNADITWLLDYHQIHLLLIANPDGRKRAEDGILWRKNADNLFCKDSKYRGVDLNRNFEFRWGCCNGSSNRPCDEEFRGPSPASEPETIAIQEYLGAIFSKQVQSPVGGSGSSSRSGTFLDIHSYGGLVYWPWGSSSDPPPDAMALQSMGRKLAYFTGYHPEQSSTMYYTDGESEDFAYGEIGVAAFCIEVGTEFFEECDEFENVILQPNLEALIYAAKASRSPYEIPRGPDIAAIDLSNHETGFLLNVLVDARGYSNVNGTETVRKIAGAELYIDTPPWIESATPFPLSAVDGRFDSAVEQASAVIGSIPLAPGQHILYVRGYNSDGEFGAVSAVFFQKTGAHEFIELLLLQ